VQGFGAVGVFGDGLLHKVAGCCFAGEGGSGGALALGVGDRVLMQENACYSVITPEGCAAILYGERTPERVAWAAEALKITATDLLSLEVIDAIIPEPPGGAHRHPEAAVAAVGDVLEQQLKELIMLPVETLMEQRYTKFRRMGSVAITDGVNGEMGKRGNG